MSKATTLPPPMVYRDNPALDDASTSSAVSLHTIDGYVDSDELPPSYSYTDEPVSTISADSVPIHPTLGVWYRSPPELPFSSHDLDCSEFRTRFPNFSTNATTLYDMIREQTKYPPGYYVNITGWHNETKRQGNKETKSKIIDFLIRINITHLLARGVGLSGEVECLPNNVKGYRGGRISSSEPTVIADEETQTDELKAWCEEYVSNPAGVKSFMLKREIINHDTKKLEQHLRSTLAETNYRGHVEIDFPSTHKRLIVYSPGKINEWRITTWIRWVFYLTFFWLISWPVLFFLTHKYEVVKVIFPYADRLVDDGGGRTCTIMSEVEWLNLWESSIRRAALARMMCKDRCLDDAYRRETAAADARGLVASSTQEPDTNIGNAALNILRQGLRVAEGFHANRGWGGDC
ncbi:hypothetical protein ACHAP3_005708 [Botrytis cinerea]